MNYSNSQKFPSNKKKTKKSVIFTLILLGAILGMMLYLSSLLLEPLVPENYIVYIHLVEVALAGFFVVQKLSWAAYNFSIDISTDTARSIRSLVRISGAIVVIIIIVSYLSRDPVTAVSLTTVSGLVIGFASQNLIGNAIAGMYLAITRPFKIGDKVTVFGNTGLVRDIGLLYSRLVMENNDIVLASNSSLVTTVIILRRSEENK